MTYGEAPSSFQTYLQWIVYKDPIEATPKRTRSHSESACNAVVDKDDPITALPGLGEHSASLLSSVGMNTVADLQLEYERCGRNRTKMFEWLKEAIPGAHPISLHRSVRWLAEDAREERIGSAV